MEENTNENFNYTSPEGEPVSEGSDPSPPCSTIIKSLPTPEEGTSAAAPQEQSDETLPRKLRRKMSGAARKRFRRLMTTEMGMKEALALAAKPWSEIPIPRPPKLPKLPVKRIRPQEEAQQYKPKKVARVDLGEPGFQFRSEKFPSQEMQLPRPELDAPSHQFRSNEYPSQQQPKETFRPEMRAPSHQSCSVEFPPRDQQEWPRRDLETSSTQFRSKEYLSQQQSEGTPWPEMGAPERQFRSVEYLPQEPPYKSSGMKLRESFQQFLSEEYPSLEQPNNSRGMEIREPVHKFRSEEYGPKRAFSRFEVGESSLQFRSEEESLQEQSEGSLSRKREEQSSRQNNTATGCSRLGVRNTTPMSVDQMGLLKEALLDAIFNAEEGKGPKFTGFSYKPGWVMVLCEDQESQNWLMAEVPKLKPWPEAELSIIIESELPKPNVGTAFLPFSEAKTVERAVGIMKAQNRGLNIDRWRILNKRVEETGHIVTFSIDEASVEVLKANKGQATLGFKKIYFKLKGEPNPNPKPHATTSERASAAVQETQRNLSGASRQWPPPQSNKSRGGTTRGNFRGSSRGFNASRGRPRPPQANRPPYPSYGSGQ